MPGFKSTISGAQTDGKKGHTDVQNGSRSILWIPVICAAATYALYSLSVNFPNHPSATNR